MAEKEIYDFVIIGGGFFGSSIALHLRSIYPNAGILILERESDLMQRASYNNQARVHNGYHYPRSILTALRSRVNFPRFTSDYRAAIDDTFDKYYAVATQFSKVSAKQFGLFCEKIGAEITPAPRHVKQWFDNRYISDVFSVKEYAFNSRLLKNITLDQLQSSDIKIRLKTEVEKVLASPDGKTVRLVLTNGDEIRCREVYNAAYSGINLLNQRSQLPLVPIKHELTEMCLIEVPEEFKHAGVTVMCGPFFSFMPFPDKKLHTLSHVRYTPHGAWTDEQGRDGYKYLESIDEPSAYEKMIKDVERYMPAMRLSRHKESLWEVKTVLQQSESDDSRPILFKRDHGGIRGYHCIMGGKIDNIYDVFEELSLLYGAS